MQWQEITGRNALHLKEQIADTEIEGLGALQISRTLPDNSLQIVLKNGDSPERKFHLALEDIVKGFLAQLEAGSILQAKT